jgi:hypothetical protein
VCDRAVGVDASVWWGCPVKGRHDTVHLCLGEVSVGVKASGGHIGVCSYTLGRRGEHDSWGRGSHGDHSKGQEGGG